MPRVFIWTGDGRHSKLDAKYARVATSTSFPARFMLAAAMNPCPCGHHGDATRECRCGPVVVARYLQRLSGPLLDRIDIHLAVPPVAYRDLALSTPAEPSRAIPPVGGGRQGPAARSVSIHAGVYANTYVSARDLRRFCHVTTEVDDLLRTAITRFALSARAYHRVLKIARTIADLDGEEAIGPPHVREAIQYRSLDRGQIYA